MSPARLKPIYSDNAARRPYYLVLNC